MKNMPLVSVGIITFNHKEFIGGCIDSVLIQDYENIEIVIADDASTDGTQDILREYQKKYPHKITLKLSQKNQGIVKNANQLHFNCKGKYITFLSGDDLFLTGKIKKQVEYMEAHPECTISYHNSEIFDTYTGKFLGYYNNAKKYAYAGGVEKLFIHGVFNGAFSMARRDKTPKNGFNEKIPLSPDWLYWIETLMNGGEVHYINEVLARYRRHENNITMTEPTIVMIWEKFLTVLIAVGKCPRLIKYFPALTKDVCIRLSHNFLKPPPGVVIIKGKSLLRAYTLPE